MWPDRESGVPSRSRYKDGGEVLRSRRERSVSREIRAEGVSTRVKGRKDIVPQVLSFLLLLLLEIPFPDLCVSAAVSIYRFISPPRMNV